MAQKYRTLADYFKQTGKTQESLAKKLGVKSAYVSMLAAGKRQPGLTLALEISRITGVPVEALLMPETERAS